MEIFKAVGLFFAGIIGGLYAANVGGGALISFPLLLLAGLSTTSAIATQRLAAVILEGGAALKFYRTKNLDLRLGLFLGIAAAAGSLLGSKILISINERYLNLIIGALLIIITIFILFKEKFGIKEIKLNKIHFFQLFIFTFLLGVYGGFFGAGFGIFIMMLLVFFGLSYIKGAAIGRMVGFFMSITAAIVFANSGLINYLYGVSLGLGFAVGGWIGISYAIKKGNEFVKGLLVIVVILSILKLISGFFNIKII